MDINKMQAKNQAMDEIKRQAAAANAQALLQVQQRL
jgi:hypothetical protein